MNLAEPNHPDILDDAARALTRADRYQDAITLGERLWKLVPDIGGSQLYHALWASGDRNGALTAIRSRLVQVPNNTQNRDYLGLYEAVLGNADAAIAELQLSEMLRNNMGFIPLALHIYAYGRIGRTDEASRLFATFDPPIPSIPYRVLAYLGVGDLTSALDLLTELADAGEGRDWRIGQDIAHNVWSDPVLDQLDFREVRQRLASVDF